MADNYGEKFTMLWYLPYDSETVFQPLLKIFFSTYISKILTKKDYSAFQQTVVAQIKDKECWSEKSWIIINFFQFLNESFDLNSWDENINFLEEDKQRKCIAKFRQWIDAQRLYLFCFLKLDSKVFQQNRIFMALYRTLIFFAVLFNQYPVKEFNPQFLKHFVSTTKKKLSIISQKNNSNDIQVICHQIETVLINFQQKEYPLITFQKSNKFKEMAKFIIGENTKNNTIIEQRLAFNYQFKFNLLQKKKQNNLPYSNEIDKIAQSVQASYNPIKRIIDNHKQTETEKNTTSLEEKINFYKQVQRREKKMDQNLFKKLHENNHNPYGITNYQIYGESTKVEMEKKKEIETFQKQEIVLQTQRTEAKIYSHPDFQKVLDTFDSSIGKVTQADFKKTFKNVEKKKESDSKTKIYNLKWVTVPIQLKQNEQKLTKQYSNNLFFKTSQDENNIYKQPKMALLMKQKQCVSQTVALMSKSIQDVFPSYRKNSFGCNLYDNKQPLMLDTVNFKLVDRSKFDFLRKVITYMAAKKKIKNILQQKNVPDTCPRSYQDIHQEWCDLRIQKQKIDFACGYANKKSTSYF